MLLECFESNSVLSLGELVRLSGLSKTTTHRLAATLVEGGWLQRAPDGRYLLSLKAFRVGQAALSGIDLHRDGLPLLRELAERSGDTTYLMIPDGIRALCLDRIDGDRAVPIADLMPGRTQELHLGAGPRAILAYRQGDLLRAVLQHGLARRTEKSITTEADLLTDLAEIRSRGYAVSRGDATAGVGALGAPVFDHTGTCVAAISVGGLLERVAPIRESELSSLLLEACAQLSRRLGHVRTDVTWAITQ